MPSNSTRTFIHVVCPFVGIALASAVIPACGQTADSDTIGRLSQAVSNVSISGRVTGSNGGGVAGVTITLSGAAVVIQKTDENGNYSFTNLGAGSYSVRPTLAGCTFTPDTANLHGVSGPTTQDFAGSGSSCVGTLPPDAGTPDSGGVDSGSDDGGSIDSGSANDGSVDSGAADSGTPTGIAISAFGLLASQTITLGARAKVNSGAVGAGATAGNPYTLVVGSDSRIPGNLFGVATQLQERAVVGNVWADRLSAPSATYASKSPFVAPPAVPQAAPFTTGTQSISVPSGSQALAAGAYAAVSVQGTLVLSGGTYDIASLTLGAGATLRASAPSIVRIATSLTAQDRAVMGTASGLNAGALRLVVGGGPTAVQLSTDVHLTGLLLAPASSVVASDRLVVTGAIAAASIRSGNDPQTVLSVGFECSTAAQCDDADACTQDACIDGFCAHQPVSSDTGACMPPDAGEADVVIPEPR